MLGGIQFETRIAENLNLDALEQTIERFAASVAAGDAALLYYTGYGLQSGGENYLLGADFDPNGQAEIDYTAYSMRRALNVVEARGGALSILLFDAAYDDPALRKRYPQIGLASLTPGRPGGFVGFAAAPNQGIGTASGSPVSRYARALIESLPTPGMNLDQAFALVKRRVSEASGGLQVPAEMSTVVAEFRFNPKSDEQVAWERTSSGGPAEWEAFLRSFPSSPHAAEARDRLAAQQKQTQSTANRTLAEQAIREYQRAFEQRDLEALKVVWPSLSRQEMTSFQEFFRIARSIALVLEPAGEPELSAEAATWAWRRKVDATDERGKLPAQENEVVFKLKRAGARMVIDSITVKRK
jgi:uncharacterized caspase-like protein